MTEANQRPLRPITNYRTTLRTLWQGLWGHSHPPQLTHSLTCSHYELQSHTFPTRPHLYLPTSVTLAKLCPLPRALLILLQPLFRARLKPPATSSRAGPDPPPGINQSDAPVTLVILPRSGKPCVRCPAPVSFQCPVLHSPLCPGRGAHPAHIQGREPLKQPPFEQGNRSAHAGSRSWYPNHEFPHLKTVSCTLPGQGVSGGRGSKATSPWGPLTLCGRSPR